MIAFRARFREALGKPGLRPEHIPGPLPLVRLVLECLEVLLAGGVDKTRLFRTVRPDLAALRILKSLPEAGDDRRPQATDQNEGGGGDAAGRHQGMTRRARPQVAFIDIYGEDSRS